MTAEIEPITEEERRAVNDWFSEHIPPRFVQKEESTNWTEVVRAYEAALSKAEARIEALQKALWSFVNGVETGMIESPADEILTNVTGRARAALNTDKEEEK